MVNEVANEYTGANEFYDADDEEVVDLSANVSDELETQEHIDEETNEVQVTVRKTVKCAMQKGHNKKSEPSF